MLRSFLFFGKKKEGKNKSELLDKEIKHLVEVEGFSVSEIKIKNESELKFIPPEKLFVSESGYAYNIDDVVTRMKSIKTLRSFVQGFTQGAKGILCDYKNLESHIEFKEKNLYFSGIDIERNTVFSVFDMQKLCEFPQIKEALIEACKGDEYFEQLLECAYGISDETMLKMENLAHQAVLFDHPLLKFNEEELGKQLNEVIMEMIKHLKSLGDKNPEIILWKTAEQIMRNNMQGEYKRFNTLIKDLDVITKQSGEDEYSSCASGFYQEFSNLYGILITFKRYGKAINYKPDWLQDSEEEEGKNSPALSGSQEF
ncbi:hypothetical protein [Legionella brunensis]|uniref:Uncharacterized protein n=1 Tax=Legionella brunensis TaxID=29422 RepID=A0A0W0SKY2_9GAMM|nr:hypothetical protein [Legionella brunensis]KTC83837.1 hypothetical protein Lbru_1660 [Legionella brunensis]